ncbi:MAG TPA: DUF5916 domain-containing protein, partial [Thermoanaerobaculia bacterium]
ITVDGDLSDPGWEGAAVIDAFWETSPGDNTPPKVRTVAYLTYDDKAFYIGVRCDDPRPDRIRAPYADRDQVIGTDDNIAVFLDTRNDRRAAMEFRVNPRGIQGDATWTEALQGNANQEDFSPDFFYDTAAKITKEGWTAEIAIPLATLRYTKADPQTWGILIWRNYPRDFRYAIYSSPLPRGSNCLLCFMRSLTGIAELPASSHWTIAPYVTAKEEGHPSDPTDPRSDFTNRPIRVDGGIDAKWTPNPDTAIDATINPDFSQVESDVAQISVNSRFALFYPEKRPFFLESSDLLQTPIQAVYTRTITSPRWGLRATGKASSYSYTALVSEDRGGGSVVLPGPESSTFAPQDFGSYVAIGRLRRDFGSSFASFLVTDREVQGGGYNRVFGPDFQWRASDLDLVTGQFLFSATENPDRPDLSPDFDGRSFSSHGLDVSWDHSTRTIEWYTDYKDFGDGFRADVGFVPQVGYRESHSFVNYKFYPSGFLNIVRPFFDLDYQALTDGSLLSRRFNPGIDVFGRWNLFAELSYYPDERFRVEGKVIPREYVSFFLTIDPPHWISRLQINGHAGEDIDFANARPGHGGEVMVSATIRPTDHLALDFVGDRQWIDVDDATLGSGRLFTAQVARLKATYTFTARAFLRLIGQYVKTDRDPALYTFSVPAKEGNFDGSALFAYKLNWQTVFYLGYGDSRALFPSLDFTPANSHYDLLRTSRQFFLKISYAFQG